MEQEKDSSLKQNTIETQGATVCLETENPCYIDGILVAVQGFRGSGFFVERDKIVTNVHVLAGATKVTAMHVDTETVYTIEGIIAFDDINDLAVLKVAEEGTPFPLGDSSIVRKSDQVCAIGYPKKKVSSAEGTVHSIRNSGKHLWLNFKLSEGNSGGPVLNVKGEVIAVAAARGISFDNSAPETGRTISSNVLKLLLKEERDVEPINVWQKRSQIRAYVAADEGDDNREQGEYKEAIVHYDTALKLNPDLSDIYNNRAATKISIGRYDEAFSDSLTALRLKPERFSFSGFGTFCLWKWKIAKLFLMSLILRFIRNVFGADNWLAIQGQMKFHLAKARAEQGNIAEARNLYRAGIDNFTEAINQRPKRGKFYNGRGWVKYLLGQLETKKGNTAEAQKLYQEAASDSDEALRLESKNTKRRSATYHTRGAAKAALGDHDSAIEDFNNAIKLKPKKTLYYHDRGLSKEALGQHEEAKADFAKAKELVDSDFEK